jgi:A/G-specific adenine glycosylase
VDFDHAPLSAQWREVPGLVEHTFTHFRLELAVYRAEVPLDAALTSAASPDLCRWVQFRDLYGAALPSVMRKVLAHALERDARKGSAKRAAPAAAAPARARRRSA